MATVLVAMSGGVDSSVAAALLVEQRHRVIGVTMKTFCYSDSNSGGRTCCGLDGIMDARRVAETLGFPHYVFDMEESFGRAVIDDFVAEYAAGRTPNPCVRCNSNTKIPDLLRRGRLLGCDWIATGHYARAATIPAATDGTVNAATADTAAPADTAATADTAAPGGTAAPAAILRARDRAKDQTYFLWGVPAAVAPYLRFPVGDLTKAEVRERARALGLATAEKPESQEICFVPTGDYGEFLEGRLGADHASLTPGPVVTSTGEVVGQHRGFARYTVGQRKGLGGGRGRPLYVLGVHPARNEVLVGAEEELLRADVRLGDLNWIGTAPVPGEGVLLQLRHRAPATAARVIAVSDTEVELLLDRPQRAVTPVAQAISAACSSRCRSSASVASWTILCAAASSGPPGTWRGLMFSFVRQLKMRSGSDE